MKKIGLLTLLIMVTVLLTLAISAAAGPRNAASPAPVAAAAVVPAAAAMPAPHPHIHEALESMRGAAGHIFNLGHGILPQARIECVEAMVETVTVWK